MNWIAPWAWLGLGTLILPVLVHLLARGRAPLRRLPTLRFVDATPPVSIRRTRLRDPLLLLLRLVILLLAVAALARPHLPTGLPAISSGGGPPLTRVILVDASPGMGRPTPGGSTALEEARRRARDEASKGAKGGSPEASPDARPEGRMVSGAVLQGASGPARLGATYLLEVDGGGGALVQAMAGAEAFLEGLPGLREVVVFSDFQVGTLPAVLASSLGTPSALPGEGISGDGIFANGIGLRLEAVAVDLASALEPVIRHPASETRVSVVATGEGIRAHWVRVPLAPVSTDDSPEGAGPGIGPGIGQGLGAAFRGRVAELAGLPVPSAGHPVEMRVLPDAARGGAAAMPLPEGRPWAEAPGWMADMALALALDPVLEAVAAAHAPPGPGYEPAVSSYLPLARSRTGEPVVVAAPVETDEGTTGGMDAGTHGSPTLMLGVHGPPESLLAAAVVAAVGQGSPGAGSSSEWDPQVLAGADLEAWRRPAVVRPGAAAGEGEGANLARLLWLGVLLLLGLEWGVRRRRPRGSADPQRTEARP